MWKKATFSNQRKVWLTSLLLISAILLGCQPVSGPQPTPLSGTNAVEETRAPLPTASATIPPSTPTPTLVPTSALAEAAAQLNGAQVSLWHPWGGAAGAALDALVHEFNGTNAWGIWVQMERQVSQDELNRAVSTALENGSLPDIVVAYPYQALKWDATQPLVRLDAYVQDPDYGYSASEQADFYPVFWEQDIWDGERFGLPALRSGQFIYYNQTWARELGFNAPPETTTQFQQQACAAAQALRQDEFPANDGQGGYLLSLQYSAMLGWMKAFGADYLPQNGGYDFNSSEVEESFTYLRNLLDQGCAWQGDGQALNDEFALRQALFVDGSIVGLPGQAETLQLAKVEMDWTVLPFPAASDAGGALPAIQVYGPSFVIFPSTPPRQLAAWVFLKWLLEPENHARLVQASSSFPLRTAEINQLSSQPAPWQAAVALIPQAQADPIQPSWDIVRWSVFDAATQLFRYYFTIDQVPDLVQLLDDTAADLHQAASK